MLDWIKNAFSPAAKAGKELEDQIFSLANEVRKQEILLLEKDEMITTLKTDINRQRENQKLAAQQAKQIEMNDLFSDIATPISQLITQSSLVEKGKLVQNRDIISVANRLIGSLKEHGLEISGEIGEIQMYNPEYHALLSTDSTAKTGDQVIIRIVGLRYQGTIMQKALVDKILEDEA